jgi:hypothetical protein
MLSLDEDLKITNKYPSLESSLDGVAGSSRQFIASSIASGLLFTLLDGSLGSKRIALDRVVFIEDDIELFGLA